MNLKKIGLFAIAMIMTLFSFQTYSFAAEEELVWVKKTSMPTGRSFSGSLVYNDKIYVYGGSTSSSQTSAFEMYDPEKDQWLQLSSASSRGHIPLVESQGKFYSFGGYDYRDNEVDIVEEYDPLSNNWTRKTPMPTPRTNVGAITMGDFIYTFGGQQRATKQQSDIVEAFNPHTNTWVSKNPMPFETSSVLPFIMNNKIYTLMYNKEELYIYYYNHVEDTWSLIDELPSEVGVPQSALVYKGKIILPSKYALYYYDINSKKVTKCPVAPLDRSAFLARIVNDKLYVIGGFKDLSTVEELGISDLIQPDSNPDPNPNPDPDPNPNPNPNPNPTGNALLVIYMDSGLIKEYEMTNEEIRNFTEWYEGRAKGNGREAYIVNKKYNIGPFNSRKDFISYSHIESFEVQEYSR
ncbi:galactose oxidase [Brevibacillus laterosporus]|uniref:Kelch repeat-containing protein n=1 Tax=Brevibacillus laterosporus TaxID=1465 RepID=UPI000C77327E|nr:kelch repeat-containing protein [Brevibacillus laterosporus]AUM66300.1 galactose oxidase [Brevibacillus laterosporus]